MLEITKLLKLLLNNNTYWRTLIYLVYNDTSIIIKSKIGDKLYVYRNDKINTIRNKNAFHNFITNIKLLSYNCYLKTLLI